MLTKQEREATIERIKSYGDSDLPFYKLLFGSRAPYAMQYTEYLKALKDRVIDLCDTSNMIELPLDKDGEVIRIHDVVYDNTGMEREVSEFRFPFYGACIYARTDDNRSTFRPDELAHKKPVTIASLVSDIKRIANQGRVDRKVYEELFRIAWTPEDTVACHCHMCDEVFRYDRGIIPNYCPFCGARVVRDEA